MEYRQTVEKIHQISNEMLSCSQLSDWEKVIDLEQERQPLLDQLNVLSIEIFDDVVAQQLHKIIAINSELAILSRLEKEDCRLKYSDAQQKKNAISAYSTSTS